jgi:hypothetical protein
MGTGGGGYDNDQWQFRFMVVLSMAIMVCFGVIVEEWCTCGRSATPLTKEKTELSKGRGADLPPSQSYS